MRRLCLDFETHYGVKFSLTQLSYTEYVRDERFEVLGVSLCWEDEDTYFVRGPDVRSVFDTIEWSSTEIVAHNTLFEALVLNEVYGIVPARYSCTQSMARAFLQGACGTSLDALARFFKLGEKLPDLEGFKGKRGADLTEEEWATLARYANNDVDVTWALYRRLAPELPPKEHDIIHETIRMFGDPVLQVDVELATEAREEARKAQEEAVGKTGYTRKEIAGNGFANILRKKAGYVPMKPSPSDPSKETFAFAKTDLEFLEMRKISDEVSDLVDARLATSSTQPITRAQRLIDLGTTGSCMLPIGLNYYAAHPGRWGGTNKMNAQNFKRGSKLRRAIIAPEGYVLGVIDSAQIQARLFVTLAGQEDAREAFADPERDPYAEMATDIYGWKVNKDDHPIERFVGKVSRLGLQFGLGHNGLYFQLITGAMGDPVDVSRELCMDAVRTYRNKNDKIGESWEIQKQIMASLASDDRCEYYDGLLEVIGDQNLIMLPNDMFLRYPGLKCDDGRYVYFTAGKSGYIPHKMWHGTVTENIIMALERIVIADQLMKINEHYRLVMTSHDEGVFLFPEDEADKALAWCLDVFRERPSWMPDVPLDAEGGYDRSYSK